jgi:predicted dehydrogenase
MDKLNVSIIGVGLFGETHALAYSQYHRSRLVAVCDTRAQRAAEIAGKYHCEWTDDAKKIAGDERIDAVSIATPDFTHYELAMRMIDAGKHLLVEKPLATDVTQAESIVKAARQAGIKLMVDFHNRWNPPFVKAKECVERGSIGSPVMGYIRLSNTLYVPTKMLSWAGKSGPQWFLFPHTIDLMRWITGEEAREVYATGTKRVLKERGIDAYDAIQAAVKFERCFATFETSWINPLSSPTLVEFEFRLIGDRGRIYIDTTKQGAEVASDTFTYAQTGPFDTIHGKPSAFMMLPIQHFVDCVLDDREPIATGDDGLAVTKIISAVETSIKTGRPVPV